MNRIDAAFTRLRSEGKKAFVAYVAAGDPSFDASLEVIKTLADAGSDIIELGLLRNDRSFKNVIKNYYISDKVVDREKHETGI